MAKAKEEKEVNKVGEDVKEAVEFVVPTDAIIDVSVDVISLPGDPYHKDGEEFKLAKRTADMLVSRGWVKLKD